MGIGLLAAVVLDFGLLENLELEAIAGRIGPGAEKGRASSRHIRMVGASAVVIDGRLLLWNGARDCDVMHSRLQGSDIANVLLPSFLIAT